MVVLGDSQSKIAPIHLFCWPESYNVQLGRKALPIVNGLRQLQWPAADVTGCENCSHLARAIEEHQQRFLTLFVCLFTGQGNAVKISVMRGYLLDLYYNLWLEHGIGFYKAAQVRSDPVMYKVSICEGT